MLDGLLNQVNLLEKGLDASWLKNDVIAGNIANVDTPNYKSKSVEFESVFRDALETDSSSSFSTTSIADLEPTITENRDSTLRMDGNNVDIDQEMTELAKNSVLYDTLTYTMAKELGRLKLVISEGK